MEARRLVPDKTEKFKAGDRPLPRFQMTIFCLKPEYLTFGVHFFDRVSVLPLLYAVVIREMATLRRIADSIWRVPRAN